MDNTVYRKTSLGEEEVAKRTLSLPVKLRSILINVDGKKNAGEIAKSLASLGDIPALLGELEQKGCIERMPEPAVPAKPAIMPAAPVNEEVRRYASDTLYQLLGPESESLVRKIEKCAAGGEFSALIEEGRDLLRSLGREKIAREFYEKSMAMLSS